MRGPQLAVATLGAMLGASIWAFAVEITGAREPFDGSMPAYALASFAAGAASALPSPRYWWLGALSVYLGEQLYAFVAFPDTRVWFLFGLFVNALIPTWIFAAAGAFATRVVAKSRSGGEAR